ncbi:MAG: ABC transporter ATP-binding protein [Bacillota bacterium]
MSDTAIYVENLSKRYRIGQREPYRALRDVLSRGFAAPFRAATSAFRRPPSAKVNPKTANNYIWALKDVSFDVNRGEVVGIIGRNGAGKSTLLKILSRITEPTEGCAEIRGRVGSLLEVGTGFHPELTGRENIYLNGAILGMKKQEIEKKFAEIVDFAEVAQFIDTPVKYYSSGMSVRLAFSVAAHLEPEILMIDEVLAVGDTGFQKKCLGKMGDVARKGRTILFVSHNMAAVANFCTRVIMLKDGKIDYNGGTNDAIQRYIEFFGSSRKISLSDRADRRGNGALHLTDIVFRNGKGEIATFFQTGDDVVIELRYESPSKKPLHNVRIGLPIDTVTGQRVTMLQNEMSGHFFEKIPPAGRITCRIPNVLLAAGRYYLTVSVTVNGVIADWIIQAGTLDIEESDFFNTGRYPETQDGIMLMPQEWTVHGAGENILRR